MWDDLGVSEREVPVVGGGGQRGREEGREEAVVLQTREGLGEPEDSWRRHTLRETVFRGEAPEQHRGLEESAF